jgi:hypothetical protein
MLLMMLEMKGVLLTCRLANLLKFSIKGVHVMSLKQNDQCAGPVGIVVENRK